LVTTVQFPLWCFWSSRTLGRLATAGLGKALPPAFIIVRQALAADRLAGRDVPPGTVVMIAPWVLHRHRRRWECPEAFDPTRFLPGAPVPDRFGFLPFGVGPRVCVGAPLAMTEATLV
jgi:cytochrome P450